MQLRPHVSQRPAPGPVDLNHYNGFQCTSERHPTLPPKPPRAPHVAPYVPSQPGYQRETPEPKQKICHGKVLEWNIKGEFGWLRPHGADESGRHDVFCASKQVVGGDLLIRGYDVEYTLVDGHRTISRNFVADAATAVPNAYGPIAKYAKARQVGRWRDRNGATAKGYYFQMHPGD